MLGDVDIAVVHGREVAYRYTPGTGSPILLIHGIGSSMSTWTSIPERLEAAGHGVLAVDLQGHGESSLDPGDFSLGAHANTIRDLLDLLAIDTVHLVGHSLGGGIAMQFVYQFPERAETLVLVSSGGLGEGMNAGLKLATLPGAGLFVATAFNRPTMMTMSWIGRTLTRVGVHDHSLTPETLETIGKLAHPQRRAAFLSTLRGVISTKGQILSAIDKLSILGDRRVLIIWGDRDPLIPVAHGERAHELLPNSRLVVFAGAGHEPHFFDAPRFADELLVHLASVQPVR